METNLAKPNAVSAQLPQRLYCISCQENVKAEQFGERLRHPMGDWREEPTFCYFPMDWATCPLEAVEVGEDFFAGDWAQQTSLDDDQKAEAELQEIGEWLS